MAQPQDALQLGTEVPRPFSIGRRTLAGFACGCLGLAGIMLLQGVSDNGGGAPVSTSVRGASAADIEMRADDPSESVCERDSGGICRFFGCDTSLGPTVCESGKCMCAPGYCAKGGRCIVQGVDPHPLSQHRQTLSYIADISALKLPPGYVPAFCAKSTDGCRTAYFPGWNCHSEFRWKQAVEQLEQVPERQSSGDIIRGNDLGYFILNSEFWNRDIGTIALGLTVEEHSFVRPILDKILGTESTQWSREQVRRSVDALMTGRKTLNVPGDVNVWSAKLLHQIHLGLNLTDAEAEEFSSLQASALVMIIQPSWNPLDVFLGGRLQDQRQKWLKKYQTAIATDQRGVFPKGLGTRDVFLLATTLLDSLLFAGGLSVPSLIGVGLAVIHSTESPLEASRRSLKEEGDVTKMVWEVIRQMPAVVGFGWWSPNGDKRTAVSLSMALRDPEVWGNDSDSFKLRDLPQYERLGAIAWALPANGPGWQHGAVRPMSRGCPASALSFVIIQEFLSAWHGTQEQWYHPEGLFGSGISIGKSTPWISSFILQKK